MGGTTSNTYAGPKTELSLLDDCVPGEKQKMFLRVLEMQEKSKKEARDAEAEKEARKAEAKKEEHDFILKAMQLAAGRSNITVNINYSISNTDEISVSNDDDDAKPTSAEIEKQS